MKRMSDIFHQEAFTEINGDRSKLRTYGKIKSKIGTEKYLLRIILSRFRLSNHNLMIEKGRHQKLQLNQRNYPFCQGGLLEDEYHFIFRAIHSLISVKNYSWSQKKCSMDSRVIAKNNN